MMEQRLRKPALLVFAALALAACGAREPQPGRWNPYAATPPRDEANFHSPAATLRAYDTNGDGTLTREEFQAKLKADFNAADSRKTGCLSSDDVLAINQKRIEAEQSAATPLQDWNQDGCVNYQEYATGPASLFDQLDENRDGKITPQEFEPRAGRGGRGGAPGGQPGAEGRGGRGGPPPR